MLSGQSVLARTVLASVASPALFALASCAVQASDPGSPQLRGEAGSVADSAGTGGTSGSPQGGSTPSAGADAVATAGSVSASGAMNAAAGASGAPASGGAATAGSGAPGTGPVSANLPFSDDFESGAIDHNRWFAVADQVLDGTWSGWSVVADDTGKAAQLTADGTERFLEGGNGAWTDQKVELRVQVLSGSPEVDVLLRYHAVKEYYYLSFAKSTFKIRDRTSANSDLQPTTKPMQVLGKWYKLTFAIQGSTLTGSLDDVVLVSGSFASTPISAGGIAIGVRDGTGVAQFDDIHVSLP